MADEKREKQWSMDENGSIVYARAPLDKRKEPPRPRCFFVRTYIDVNALYRFLKYSPCIQHWIYCVHDKDIFLDGEKKGQPKASHTHVLLYFYNGKTLSSVQKMFDRYSLSLTSDGSLFEKSDVRITGDKIGSYRYLRHLDHREKYPYGRDELVCDDFVYWKKFEHTHGMTGCEENKALAVLDDLRAGVSFYEMTMRYGNYWTLHINQHLKSFELCGHEMRELQFERDLAELLLNSGNFTDEQIADFNSMYLFLQLHFVNEYGRKMAFMLNEAEHQNLDIYSHCITEGKKNQ